MGGGAAAGPAMSADHPPALGRRGPPEPRTAAESWAIPLPTEGCGPGGQEQTHIMRRPERNDPRRQDQESAEIPTRSRLHGRRGVSEQMNRVGVQIPNTRGLVMDDPVELVGGLQLWPGGRVVVRRGGRRD